MHGLQITPEDNEQVQISTSNPYNGNLLESVYNAKGYVIFFSTETREGKVRLFNGLRGKTSESSDILHPLGHPVVDFSVYRTTYTDDDGNPVVSPKTVLRLSDGKDISLTGKAVAGAMFDLFKTFGPPPWTEPVLLKIVEVPVDSKRSYYSVVLL